MAEKRALEKKVEDTQEDLKNVKCAQTKIVNTMMCEGESALLWQEWVNWADNDTTINYDVKLIATTNSEANKTDTNTTAYNIHDNVSLFRQQWQRQWP